jgi:hypothetical protein
MNKITRFIKTIFMALRVFLIVKLSGKLGILINVDVYGDVVIGITHAGQVLKEGTLIVHNYRNLPKEFLDKDFFMDLTPEQINANFSHAEKNK